MLSDGMVDALNGQLNAEMYSAYLYLSMSAYFDSITLSGFAHWMRVQGREEEEHAMKFFHYVNEQRGRVLMQPIDGPPTAWECPLAAFEAAYEHEVEVSGLIDSLVAAAREEGDNATGAFLQWFVTEQVEEEASADAVIQKLKLIGDAQGPLLMLDKELGQRGAD